MTIATKYKAQNIQSIQTKTPTEDEFVAGFSTENVCGKLVCLIKWVSIYLHEIKKNNFVPKYT